MTLANRSFIGILAVVIIAAVIWRLWPMDPVNIPTDQTPTSTTTLVSVPQLNTEYIRAEEWPPKVVRTPGVVTCEPSEANGQFVAWKEINGRQYCVVNTSEGAAGSVFTEYQYSVADGSDVVTLSFTLKAVQCANYDEPKKTACSTERAAFNPDVLVDQAIQALR